MRIDLCTLAVAFAVSAAGSALGASEPVPLAGTAWRPVPFSGQAGSPENPVFIAFEGGDRVSGFAGCNRFTGSYQQNGGTLVIGPLATTRMACAPDVMEREQWFLKSLRQTRRIAVTAGELMLKALPDTVFLRLMPHQ